MNRSTKKQGAQGEYEMLGKALQQIEQRMLLEQEHNRLNQELDLLKDEHNIEQENNSCQIVSEWIEDEISTFLLKTTDVKCPVTIFYRLLDFWAEECRTDKFTWNSAHCGIVFEVCRSKTFERINDNFEQAKVWWLSLLAFGTYRRWSKRLTRERVLKVLRNPTSTMSERFHLLKHYTSSKTKLMAWFIKDLDRMPISIRLHYGENEDGENGVLQDQPMNIWINPTITVKALIILIESRLRISKRPIDHRVELCSSQYSFATNSHGGTLNRLGVRNDHNVHIIPQYPVDASKRAKRKSKKKRRNKQTQSTFNDKKEKTPSVVSLQTKNSPTKPTVVADYGTTEDRDRLDHSSKLTRIFEEAAVLFQERRQRLNDLAVKKCSPKQKSSKPAKHIAVTSQSVDCCCSNDVSSKAGRVFFPVLVGHEEYLYKSSKTTKRCQVSPCSLDLHGCSQDEALLALNRNLPDWLDAAMKEHPYTLPVNIITGGGIQVVADAVEHWIRENRNVANRFS